MMNAPLIAAVSEEGGLTSDEAKRAAVSVMRTMVGYLAEPEVTRVRERLSPHLQRWVGHADFPAGSPFGPPEEFPRLVSEQGGYSLETARQVTTTVVEAWSRIVPGELLRAVAGYMPAVMQALLPGRTDLVEPTPKDPVRGDLIPLCTAPVDPGWKWHPTGATGTGRY